MTEIPPEIGQDGFRSHYQRSEAPEDVRKRQSLYWHTEEYAKGLPPVDLEVEAFDALHYAGIKDTATLMDVGCSLPKFLEMWKLAGHRGRVIGIEPNSKQYDGQLPYWKPVGVLPPQKGDGTTKARTSYAREGKITRPGFEGIEMFESTVNALPLDDGEADVITSMFMFYHVPKELQQSALQEIKQQLNPETGIFVLATRGNENKERIRMNEARIAAELSDIAGREFIQPPAVNSGCTSEDAVPMLIRNFRYIYEYRHSSKFIFRNAKEAFDLEEAYWTLLDMYKDQDGKPPTQFQFAVAFDRVMWDDLQMVRQRRGTIEDELRQSLFIASDRPLVLPDKFKRLPHIGHATIGALTI